MRRLRLIDEPSTPRRRQRVNKLLAHMEAHPGYVTLDEAAVVSGAAKGTTLDSVLADATDLEPRLFEGEAISWQTLLNGAQYRRHIRVLGLLP